MITKDQQLSAIRSVLQLVGGLAVQYGYTNDTQWTLISGILLSLTSLCWGLFSHTPDATIKAAEVTPGVVKVVVKDQAMADQLAPRDAAGEPVHDKILS